MKEIKPPTLAQKILFAFLRSDLAEEVEGDLNENFYQNAKRSGPLQARLAYWYQVINYIRPFAIRKSKYFNPFPMFRHNLLISFRNFTRNKTTFVINLIGLSTGLACALFIYLWVADELSMDKFHKNGDRLMQVMQRMENAGGIGVTYSTPWLLAETLKNEFPEVEYSAVATPTDWFEDFTLSIGDKTIKATGQYVSKDYFSIFSYPLLEGSPASLLTDNNSMVITKELALKLFNNENAVGKTVEFQHEKEFKITGVLDDIPNNSSVQFDFALPVQIMIDQYPQVVSWKNSGPGTYVLLREGTSVASFGPKIEGIIKTKSDDTHRTIFLTPYQDTYLYDHYETGVQTGGRIEYVRLFTIIAIFILIIACINFMNLATAEATKRAKEVGVKKSIGASRAALVSQYLSESSIITFLAVVIAIGLTYLLLPQFNLITGKDLALHFDKTLWLSLTCLTLMTGILAGSYPAFFLSSFRPAQILKGKITNSAGEVWTRKGLVVFQFILSIVFIVAVVIVYKQVDFIQNKNLGYDKENVIYFEIEGEIKNNTQTFINELNKIPGVIKATSMGQSMVGGGNTSGIEWEGKDPSERVSFAYRPVNYDAMEMLGLQLREGRFFSRDFNDTLSVIFNQAAIETMGMTDPIGKTIQFGPYQCPIIGVIEDFHFESMHTDVKPMFFIMAPEHARKVMVKIAKGDERETLARLQNVYSDFNPGFAFDFTFLDQDYQEQYKSELRVSMLSRYFAVLAIVISCLGLFGLTTFTTERRRKEIGIRKVMGSTEWQIVQLLSTDFTKIVLIAMFVALPVSYLLAKDWLNSFAYHIDLNLIYFAGAGLIVLVITWLTVSSQAFKASRVNPASCLKDE